VTVCIELDYILEADALREACRHHDLLTDLELSEWEMLMRLRIGDVEVFGQTDEEYQAWLEHLRRNNIPLDVPSPAWSRLSVLWIATTVDDAFVRLQEKGHSELSSLDCVIHLVQQGETVRVFLSHDRVGQASMAESHAAFAVFADRVRDDFLAVCPALINHVTLGYWFRREPNPPQVLPPPILL
jgi:hypothetical protein